MLKIRIELWLVVFVLAVVAGLLAPSVMAGDRVAARIDEPFEVDGEVFASGRLTLHELGRFTPVATLNEVRVDGRSLGVVLARVELGSTIAVHDELIFERGDNGRLVLASVAREGQPIRKLYRLPAGEDAGHWRAVARPASAVTYTTR